MPCTPQDPSCRRKVPREVECSKAGDLAVGVWNLNLRGDFDCSQVLRKAQAALFDKVCNFGLTTIVWREPQPSVIENPLDLRPGSNICSCVTEGSRSSDVRCLTCYGTSHIGGYEQWGYTYLHLASVSPKVQLLNNCTLDRDIKPNRIMLDSGKTSGTFETGDIPFSNTKGYPFETKLDAFMRSPGNAVDVSYSLDSGATWEALHTLLSAAEPPRSGSVRFRVLLRRASASDRSPAFEILRLRWKRVQYPFIKVLKNAPRTSRAREQYGRTDGPQGMQWWTMPLRFFDEDTVASGTAADRIDDGAFIQVLEGANLDARFAVTNLQHTDPMGTFMSQRFNVRRLQPNEIAYQVF